MSKVDWTKPIEAVRKSDGKVVPVALAAHRSCSGQRATNEVPDGNETNEAWNEDGSDCCYMGKWYIRNVAEPKDGVPVWAVKRALAEVNDFPTGPGGGEKWTMDEIIDRRRGVFRYQAAVITLARYIAAHEQPPVDPDEVEAEGIVGRMAQDGFHIATTNEGLCAEAALRAIKRGRELERGEGK